MRRKALAQRSGLLREALDIVSYTARERVDGQAEAEGLACVLSGAAEWLFDEVTDLLDSEDAPAERGHRWKRRRSKDIDQNKRQGAAPHAQGGDVCREYMNGTGVFRMRSQPPRLLSSSPMDERPPPRASWPHAGPHLIRAGCWGPVATRQRAAQRRRQICSDASAGKEPLQRRCKSPSEVTLSRSMQVHSVLPGKHERVQADMPSAREQVRRAIRGRRLYMSKNRVAQPAGCPHHAPPQLSRLPESCVRGICTEHEKEAKEAPEQRMGHRVNSETDSAHPKQQHHSGDKNVGCEMVPDSLHEQRPWDGEQVCEPIVGPVSLPICGTPTTRDEAEPLTPGLDRQRPVVVLSWSYSVRLRR
eukprot:CAMPEP_0206168932 /NCGR_PEP_ID=MMETSP1474-20131121/33967_1 /ASSEMBLY_ACC=CAM_ASM_001110 /TAXON_ID=97495 /ORGANISM="Imantonia sp., Strain RCC918" /LENGTH=359 /DNA_ID=CAMNT_0053574613 /DNA_START=225 /DNA_END=1303 /DNA_ORIENTATION=+